MSEQLAIEALGLARAYRVGDRSVVGLQRVSLSVLAGEVVAVMGPSGSGKSTLLFLLGGLDRPDEGTVRVTGVDWATLNGRARANFRRGACGFIVQGQALLPQATAAENVEVPLLLDSVGERERGTAVAAALDRVGLGEHAGKLPDQLSGGEQQRVSIARALVGHPAVVLADEPTGNLDSATSAEVVRLLVAAAVERETAVVLVTHDPAVAAHADRVVRLRSGELDAHEREIPHRGAVE
jgi:putative ABC transport system ATP-binding protein